MERIRQLREAKKLSQLRLGGLIDAAQETVSGYEIGRSEPDIKTLCKLSEVLDASVDYILGLTDVKTIIRTSELTEKETELLTTFRSLSTDRKERALGMLSGLVD